MLLRAYTWWILACCCPIVRGDDAKEAEEAFDETCLDEYIDDIGMNLTCSGCAYSAASLTRAFGTKIDMLKSLSVAGRKALLKTLMNTACLDDNFPKEMIATKAGASGLMQFMGYEQFLNDMGGKARMKGADKDKHTPPPASLGEAGIKHHDTVVSICKTIMSSAAKVIIDKALAKKRPDQFTWERYLCKKKLSVCHFTWHYSDEEGDADDEEEDIPVEGELWQSMNKKAKAPKKEL
eukprot:gnl/TRDRNA2_/TRDRNA2_188707_c0_seq1.p1 gnl/TRDRNA2_/TRDRNA2_188707_c0~~gnl/TRDRNA2_/TRDRNA2_188707_c0_seq1.p1  ORF type:complete len:237 (+),score=58.93 gnl/TRDRNA2_/TRDRNA2_188707_c0_seq1:52-762(+)